MKIEFSRINNVNNFKCPQMSLNVNNFKNKLEMF